MITSCNKCKYTTVRNIRMTMRPNEAYHHRYDKIKGCLNKTKIRRQRGRGSPTANGAWDAMSYARTDTARAPVRA